MIHELCHIWPEACTSTRKSVLKRLSGSTLLFLQAVAADAKGSDYYLYDYEVDELGNKKEKTAKKERSKRLMDPTVTQNCRGE